MAGLLSRYVVRSRFGRRLLFMFVTCTIVPLTILAILSFRQVRRQLDEQSQARLTQATRSIGMAVYDRLTFLDAELRRLRPEELLKKAGARRLPGLDEQSDRWFSGVSIVSSYGTEIPLSGFVDTVPTLTRNELGHVRLGRTLITTVDATDGRRLLFMVRRVAEDRPELGTIVALLNQDQLWGLPQQNVVSASMQLAVLDSDNRVLFRSVDAPSAFASEHVSAIGRSPSGTFEWIGEGGAHRATWWSVPLKSSFFAPRWTLVVSESQADIFAPLASFRRNFILLLLLCLWVVMLMGVRQIRRGLGPLRALQHGTRRIAGRDFESRVTIRSRDEFEELGDAFNAMATRLGRQFSALRTGAAIDRAILSALDTSHIIDTVLSRLREVYPCDVVAVTMLDPGEASLARTFTRIAGPQADTSESPCSLTEGDRKFLERNPRMIVLLPEDSQRSPEYLAVPAAAGARSFVLLPLIVKDELSGVIVLGNANTMPTMPEDLEHARGIADQVAVALSNVRMLDQVRFLAYYDSLTHLPNRVLNRERLQQALARARRERLQVAVFFLDLDHFGRINDTLGHDLGDQLVRDVASRISACCRTSDEVGRGKVRQQTSVARLGGDEFTIILPDIHEPQAAARVAQRLLQTFSEPFALGGQEVFVTASIGIAVFPDDGDDIEGLLKNADSAMYHAKQQGRNNFQMYSRSMNEMALTRLTLENELRHGIERKEFVMHYQPLADLATGRIVGMEALVRWQHPRLGLVSPLSFIPLAEETGLIAPLGEWILRTACAQSQAWREAGLPPVRVAVNLSSRQFRQRDLIDMVRRTLRDTRLDPASLELELTESILMQQVDENIATLNAFKAMGVRLSIDDFGTGYSSLSYLKHFPLDTLKVDRSFVCGVPDDAEHTAIASAIIAMAHAMDLHVIAEGVETLEQLAFLSAQGCEEVQGYLFARPVTAEVFSTLLRDDHRLAVPAAGARRRKAG